MSEEQKPKLIDHEERFDSVEPRRFYLRRMKDETGISRTGRVLEGVLWQDSKVTVQWRPPACSMGIYNSLDEFNAIHVDCHPSCSEIVWIDEPRENRVEYAEEFHKRWDGRYDRFVNDVFVETVSEVPVTLLPPRPEA